jgi:membrane protein DedA with SNARE-associated domain
LHGFGDHIFEILRGYFAAHGYWTLFFALLLENAGIPLPGETMLLFASFLAFSEHQLQLPWIILTGIVATTLGDNLGYSIGRRGGRPLLDRYVRAFSIHGHAVEKAIEKGEELFRRHGDLTIFVARFIFGMRIIAGPLAGVLRMPWGKFVLFNFLGAATWVTVIAVAGYKFGEHWAELIKIVGRANLGITVVTGYVALLIWRRHRAARQKTKGTDGEVVEKQSVEETKTGLRP